jgi:hypothetical protein
VGIARCRRDFQGRVGTGGNLGLVFAGFHAPAFSTALFGVNRFTVRSESSHYMGAESYRYTSIQMFVDRHGGARQWTEPLK